MRIASNSPHANTFCSHQLRINISFVVCLWSSVFDALSRGWSVLLATSYPPPPRCVRLYVTCDCRSQSANTAKEEKLRRKDRQRQQKEEEKRRVKEEEKVRKLEKERLKKEKSNKKGKTSTSSSQSQVSGGPAELSWTLSDLWGFVTC